MPRSDIPKTRAKGSKRSSGIALTFLTGDPTNQHQILHVGRPVMLLARNSGGAPYTVTVDSTPDIHSGRTGDISTESVAAGATRVFGPFDANGWAYPTGYIHVDVENAALLLAAIEF